MDRSGLQVPPDEVAPPTLDAEDARLAASAIMHDERLPEDERLRLMWALLDAARFGLPGDDQ
jgi:hypothetical protein